MNKKEFIHAIAEKESLTITDVEKAISAGIDIIMDTVAQGEDVQFVGFGIFSQSSRAERAGRNPKTKEAIIIPACKTPKFKAGKLFKDAIKN